ncbi:MAG: response regulator transcription factor [Clostridiales bacterium]|nr:response regulator transcription factor [Clostridiales bacterium]MDY5514633.1 response regulator transcription factor [Candidatus Ventricola sp.]
MNKLMILVVEDDKSVRNLIATTLRTNGYRFTEAPTGEEAIIQASSHNPDVILLDLGLPDMEGIDVIRRVRGWSNVPIIVISARSEDADKIGALDAGADDYLTKPFSVDELMARLRATQRRLAYTNTSAPADSTFVNGALRVDYAANTASVNGEELRLTPIEYRLLCLLAQNVGKVLTHTFITQRIWGKSMESDIASLRVYMAMLRRKIESASGSETQYIQTHIGIGYRMIKL